MKSELPFIPIDEDFSLNITILTVLLTRLATTNRGSYVLDFEKIQALLYLIKNPAKINDILTLAGKQYAPLDTRYTHTIESMSNNVDILFDRDKLKYLFKSMAAWGLLGCYFDEKQKNIKYYMSKKGLTFSESLEKKSAPTEYYFDLVDIIESVAPLQSQPTTKINSWLNITFKRN